MNLSWSRATRRTLSIAGGLAVLFLAGCLEKRVVWSPDGARALVITKEAELFVCDAGGRLSDRLASGTKLAVWFSDSQRIAFAVRRDVKDWATLAPLLGERRGDVEARADDLWRALEQGAPWGVVTVDLKGQLDLALLRLREAHGPALKTRLTANEWAALAGKTVGVTDVMVARVDAGKLVASQWVSTHVGAILELRPAPGGNALAWTQECLGTKDDYALAVATLDGGKPVIVAPRAAGFPDWDTTGRALVYVEAPPGRGGDDENLVLGVVTRRGVLNENGALALEEKPTYLAGTLFSTLMHVRCLRDGRVLFNALEMSLPLAAADYAGNQREQLFAVDPSRQATLVRMIPRGREADLPQGLSFFEVSPNGEQVVFGGDKGEVAILTLATGDVSAIQGADRTYYQGLPSWRGPSELCFVKRMPAVDGQPPRRPAEIILRRGEKETVLSQDWSDALLANVASKDRD
ncbi:hypothetical protein [Opitutus sp. ER46]|uniref:hypothetical protein n=1 Tax=Opitutus sp. ER46 TaxID=2161864 RepID=UPI000D31622F|nr:hypothetical protein [Opitutus sp. ER46]PTX90756.1 hypothetical protein DB354_19035 [Opitutus sp. ER46]